MILTTLLGKKNHESGVFFALSGMDIWEWMRCTAQLICIWFSRRALFFGAEVQLCFLSTIYDDNRHFIVSSVNAGCWHLGQQEEATCGPSAWLLGWKKVDFHIETLRRISSNGGFPLAIFSYMRFYVMLQYKLKVDSQNLTQQSFYKSVRYRKETDSITMKLPSGIWNGMHFLEVSWRRGYPGIIARSKSHHWANFNLSLSFSNCGNSFDWLFYKVFASF